MDREAWWATVHGVTKSWTQLSDLACMHQTYIYHLSISHNLKLHCSLRHFEETVVELLFKYQLQSGHCNQFCISTVNETVILCLQRLRDSTNKQLNNAHCY